LGYIENSPFSIVHTPEIGTPPYTIWGCSHFLYELGAGEYHDILGMDQGHPFFMPTRRYFIYHLFKEGIMSTIILFQHIQMWGGGL